MNERDCTWLGMRLENAVFFGLAIGVMLAAIVGMVVGWLVVGDELKNTVQAYEDGYMQGVRDALGDPEQALATLLWKGEYNVTVTIDGHTFQLVCQEKG